MRHSLPTLLLILTLASMAAATSAAQTPTIITRADGETKIYARQGTGTYTYFGTNVNTESQLGQAAEMVFAPDGETVYFRQLISQDYENRTYVKGVIEGNKVRIPHGQYVSYDIDDERGLQLYHLHITNVDDNDDYDWTYVPDDQDITFTIDGNHLILDGGVTIDPVHQFPTEAIGLVYSNDHDWPGLCDYQTVLTLVEDSPVAAPQGAEAITMVLNRQLLNTETGEMKDEPQFVKAVIAEQDIYLSGLGNTLPGGWIHGTITDNKAVFESRQFMGVGPENELVYFVAAQSQRAKVAPYPDEPDFTEWGYSHTMTDRLVFNYDKTSQNLTTTGTILINRTADNLLPLTAFVAPSLEPFVEVAATPQNPVVGDYFLPYDEENEFLYISVFIPNTATDGSLLVTDKLSWRVFVNGEPFVFVPGEYPLIDKEMAEIPYGFTDCEFPQMGSFVTFLVPGTLLYFYRSGIETIGVESVYRGGGKERVSQRVIFDTATQTVTTSISSIQDGGKTPVSVTYTDMQGRQLSHPTGGVVIRTTAYSDGTRTTTKLILR